MVLASLDPRAAPPPRSAEYTTTISASSSPIFTTFLSERCKQLALDLCVGQLLPSVRAMADEQLQSYLQKHRVHELLQVSACWGSLVSTVSHLSTISDPSRPPRSTPPFTPAGPIVIGAGGPPTGAAAG